MRISLLTFFVLFFGLGSKAQNSLLFEGRYVEIQQITESVFMHTSFLKIPRFGKYPCNGMVVIHEGEALVFDTPVDDSASAELISWIQKRAQIKAVVINHFHNDCLGGLAEFHRQNIASFASYQTIALVDSSVDVLPQNGFDDSLRMRAVGLETVSYFFGEGHTADNLVSYCNQDKVLFGGCLLKSLQAGKGNLADANVAEWSNTVEKVKGRFPDVNYVIPGHGPFGNSDLLDYTITLFDSDRSSKKQ